MLEDQQSPVVNWERSVVQLYFAITVRLVVCLFISYCNYWKSVIIVCKNKRGEKKVLTMGSLVSQGQFN